MPGFPFSSNRKKGSSNCLFLGVPETVKSIFLSVWEKSTAQGDCNAHFYAGDRIILLLFVPVRCTKPVVHFLIKWSDNLIRFRKFSAVLSLDNPCIQRCAWLSMPCGAQVFWNWQDSLISCGSDSVSKSCSGATVGDIKSAGGPDSFPSAINLRISGLIGKHFSL